MQHISWVFFFTCRIQLTILRNRATPVVVCVQIITNQRNHYHHVESARRTRRVNSHGSPFGPNLDARSSGQGNQVHEASTCVQNLGHVVLFGKVRRRGSWAWCKHVCGLSLFALLACLVLFLINDTKQLVSGKFLVCCSFSSLESFATQLTFAWTTFSRSLPFFVLSQRHHTCIHAMIALSNLVTQTQGILSTCARFSRNNLH